MAFKVLLPFFVLCLLLSSIHAQQHSIRLYGHGFNDLDRIKIPLENGTNSTPVNLGADMTIEFWMKANAGTNTLGNNASQGSNDDWTLGHIIVDRDIFGPGDFGDYGISLAGGRIAFGVNNGSNSYTIIGAGDLRNGEWHHIAVTRENTGRMRLFVNGALQVTHTNGPGGNIAYRVGRALSNQCSGPCLNEPYIILGAEKHDYDPNVYPSFNGWIDELRISNTIRYTAAFTPDNIEFTPDVNTVGLYHFNEGTGTFISDDTHSSNTTPTSGTLIPHPDMLPHWSTDTPFQALSASDGDWFYLLQTNEVIFHWYQTEEDINEFAIEYYNPQTEEAITLPYHAAQSEIHQSRYMISVPYSKAMITPGFHRVLRKDVAGTWHPGKWRKIDWSEQVSLKAFPNPAAQYLIIESETSFKHLELLNLQSNQLRVYSWPPNAQQFLLFTGDLPNGMYLGILTRENGTRERIKINVQH